MKHTIRLILALYISTNFAYTQSLETYFGDKRFGVDVLLFKNFNTVKQEKNNFMFISRNRASTDYKNSSLVFSSTNAISYNLKKGIGIISIASFSGNGFIPKLGFHYLRSNKNFIFFGWLVADIKEQGGIEMFAVIRYQPTIHENLKLYTQLETFPIYHLSNSSTTLTERLRVGAHFRSWVIGPMADLSLSRGKEMIKTYNVGVFLRHEF